MELSAFSGLAVGLVALTALILLVVRDWRVSIAALCLQYLGVFLLVGVSWTTGMAATKLVAGWISGAVLGMGLSSLPRRAPEGELNSEQEADTPFPRRWWISTADTATASLFRLLSALLIGLVVVSVAPQANQWISGMSIEQVRGGLILVGLGLLQLGFTARPFRATLGLLTALSGFEIFYSAVERSTLVAGLSAAVTMGLALTGAYLLVVSSMEISE